MQHPAPAVQTPPRQRSLRNGSVSDKERETNMGRAAVPESSRGLLPAALWERECPCLLRVRDLSVSYHRKEPRNTTPV